MQPLQSQALASQTEMGSLRGVISQNIKQTFGANLQLPSPAEGVGTKLDILG